MLSLAFLFISWQWMQTFRALTEKIIVKRTEGGRARLQNTYQRWREFHI